MFQSVEAVLFRRADEQGIAIAQHSVTSSLHQVVQSVIITGSKVVLLMNQLLVFRQHPTGCTASSG